MNLYHPDPHKAPSKPSQKVFLPFSVFLSQIKNKKAPTEADARKTQTPIAATQTEIELGPLNHNYLLEFALLPNSKDSYGEKRV